MRLGEAYRGPTKWMLGTLGITAAGLVLSHACTYSQGSPHSAAEVLDSVIQKEGLSAVVQRYDAMSAARDKYYFDLQEITLLGYRLIREDRIAAAVEVLSIGTREFPESWDAWDSLGEVFMYVGDAETSRRHYERSLELNPDNQNARKKIRNLDSYILGMSRETRHSPRHENGAQTGIKGPYLGQHPPGSAARVFAPGLVSTRGGLEYGCSFSPDGKECYFTRNVGKLNGLLLYCRQEDDGWTAPREVPISVGHTDFDPYVTPSGNRLIFGRKTSREDGTTQAGLWAATRVGNEWGLPESFQPTWMHLSMTSNGHIYVNDHTKWGYVCLVQPTEHGFSEPEPVGGGVNPGAHPAVSKDESFIVVDSERPDCLGSPAREDSDLFVCFRREDGSWGEAVNLGPEVNTDSDQAIPRLSPDGRYLFFTRDRDIYWVSVEAIERLRP